MQSHRSILKYLTQIGLSLGFAFCLAPGTVLGQASLESYEETARRNPDNDVAHYCLANALFKAGQNQRAITEYRRAYALSHTEQMRAFCQQMLQKLGINISGSRSSAGRQVQAPSWMSAPTSAPIEQFHQMAKTRGSRDRDSDSHKDGVDVFDQTPGRDFDSWITEFRYNFGVAVKQQLMRRGYPSMYGSTMMIFSVDHHHKLRARILRSSAPPVVTNMLLDTTRAMDGRSILDFPKSSNLDGFNFSMSWAFPEAPRGYRDVEANLRNAKGRILSQNGMRAQTGIMNYNTSNASGALATKNANGRLVPGSNQGVDGKLAGGNVSISTDVAGLLMPKQKPIELKAKPAQKLEEK
jgi:tetratricopeptide (TPR) repeat protein